jgi:hypothetical protein
MSPITLSTIAKYALFGTSRSPFVEFTLFSCAAAYFSKTTVNALNFCSSITNDP